MQQRRLRHRPKDVHGVQDDVQCHCRPADVANAYDNESANAIADDADNKDDGDDKDDDGNDTNYQYHDQNDRIDDAIVRLRNVRS
jgi:hypothetical protein